MAVSSLTRLTVPLATNQSASAQGLLMPKLKYRFRAMFENFGVSSDKTELTKQVVDIKRPSVNFNPITLDVYNSKVYLQGKPEWQEVNINLRDDAAGNVSKLVGEQIQKQMDFLEQSSAASGIDYKFAMRIEILDGGNGVNLPGVLETTEMYGCYIQNANYNSLAYANSEPVTITLSIKFDNCIQTPYDRAGIGVPLLRTTGVLSTGGG